MRSEYEVKHKAANLKVKMIARGERIIGLHDHIHRSDAKTVRQLNPERRKTMQEEIEHLSQLQTSDAYVYATLRWLLGVTEDIDHTNLELNK